MSRQPDHPIDAQFLARWSPRSFTGQVLERAELMRLFEAARWSPSTSNTQPWRFVYGLAGSEGFQHIFNTLVPFNQDWARRASALVAVLSATTSVAPGAAEASPLPMHAFDTGAAWMSLALQAEKQGLRAHAMGGFDAQALRAALGVPADHAVQCVVAIGFQGDKGLLPEALQAREMPNGRKPLSSLVAEGRFAF